MKNVNEITNTGNSEYKEIEFQLFVNWLTDWLSQEYAQRTYHYNI